MNSEKSILITGSSGFIGKNLAEKLSALYKVYAPKTDELDLNDQYKVEQFFRSHKINIVIHAANYRGKLGQKCAESTILEYGLRMYANLERCSHLYDKMYYFGSGAEYDSRSVSYTHLTLPTKA